MITTELQGPGFFIFFQIETEVERPNAGYKEHPWLLPKRERYELPERFRPLDKEEKQALEIVEDVIEALPEAPERDLELALRLQLEIQDLQFKFIYLVWLEDYFQYCEMRKREEEAIFLLLLNS